MRAPRVPPPGSPALVYADEIAERRVYLDAMRIHHLDLVRRFLAAADGNIYTIGVVFGGAMTRSYSLSTGSSAPLTAGT